MTIEFHRTVMGQRFFEHTMPQLVSEIGKIGGQLLTLEHAITSLAATLDRTRLRVLFVAADEELLTVAREACGSPCELHLARTYAAAEEILALQTFDVLITDAVTGWRRTGPALFDLARAGEPRACCAVLLPGTAEERAGFAERHEADAAIDMTTPESTRRGLERLLRSTSPRAR